MLRPARLALIGLSKRLTHTHSSCAPLFAAIFDRTKRERYTKRKSSANWIPDQLTRRERDNYKRAMGYM